MKDFEQYEEVGRLGGWLIVILLSLTILTWGVSLHMLVRDVPRQWDFNSLPVAPGETVYTTEDPPPDNVNPPPQMEALPEAEPPPGGLRP